MATPDRADYRPPAFGPPYRVLLLAAAGPGWYEAPDAATRELVLARLAEWWRSWEDAGATLLTTFDDDYFVVGQPSTLGWSLFAVYDVPRLELVAEQLHGLRADVGGVRLDSAFRMEARVGRGIFFLEK